MSRHDRHDGELEGGLYHGIASSARVETKHGRHHGHHQTIPKGVLPKFFTGTSALSPTARFNTSLRPVPEVYPLVAAVCLGCVFAGTIMYHDLSKNHEVLIRKDTRKLQVLTAEEDPETFSRVTKQAKKSYDNPLARYVRGKKPDLFPWLFGHPGKDETVDLSKEKWKANAAQGTTK